MIRLETTELNLLEHNQSYYGYLNVKIEGKVAVLLNDDCSSCYLIYASA
jgi:hypothetical protein